jgi:hypothetical protein
MVVKATRSRHAPLEDGEDGAAIRVGAGDLQL